MHYLLLVALLGAALAEDFTGHRVLDCTPTTEAQLKALNDIRQQVVDVDFWRPPAAVGRTVTVRIPPTALSNLLIGGAPIQPLLLSLLQQANVSCEVKISDLQQAIDEESRLVQGRNSEYEADDYDYNNYHKLEVIHDWVDNMVKEYPDLVTPLDIGTSYEGRKMKGLKISRSETKKKAVFIEGGIHAREWISPATVVYMTKMLVELGDSPLLDELDWYVIPVVNVDGYEFTWNANRMWRKTRRPNPNSSCVGTDPNRNWPIHWGEDGASRNQCAEDYAGPEALSEPEIKAVTSFLSSNEIDFVGFIDFHSFSQMWMCPWGWTTDLPSDYENLDSLSKAAVDALEQVHGTRYVHGSIANVIYKASGSSADWTYANGIKYSYAVELRDTGRYGFVLPPEEIQPSAEETFEALKAFGTHIINN